MRRSTLQGGALAGAVALAIVYQAWGFPEFSRKTKAACIACHVNPAGGTELTEAGKAFKTDMKKHPATAPAGAEYVGSQKCRICHMREHQTWQETPHASALQMLKNADPRRVAAINEPDVGAIAAQIAEKLKIELKGPPAETDACVTCHVTGFHLPGGYPAQDSTRNAGVSAVGCEACHGPGSRHVRAPSTLKKKFIQRNPGAKLCMQCHTPVMTPKFDYDDFKKRGTHAIPAAAK